MNEKKAKMIRKKVYGDFSPKFRDYTKLDNGQIIADKKRRVYQKLKVAINKMFPKKAWSEIKNKIKQVWK